MGATLYTTATLTGGVLSSSVPMPTAFDKWDVDVDLWPEGMWMRVCVCGNGPLPDGAPGCGECGAVTVGVVERIDRCTDCGTLGTERDSDGCKGVLWTEPEINFGERCHGEKVTLVDAVTVLVEVTGPSHHRVECSRLRSAWGPRAKTPDNNLLMFCKEGLTEGDLWHTPCRAVVRLDVPDPVDVPTVKDVDIESRSYTPRPAVWWVQS